MSVRFWVLMLLLLGALPANAQEEADEENPYRPGLVATYSAAGLAATRLDETVAFDWQDAAPDPRLPAGEFSAIWRGRLWAQADGKYQLLCFAQGSVEVKLAGKTVLTGQAESPQWLSSQPLELTFDRHELEITYRRSGPRGQLALFWTGPEFRLEPIAARFLSHNKERSPSSEFERGRQLAAALRCAACHRDQSASVTPAPALDRLSGNVHEAWLVDWLSNHAAGSSPRRMPDLGLTRDEAAAVAAWLLREPATKVEVKLPADRPAKAKSKNGKKKGEEEPPKPTAGEGQRLLLTRGCLACHQLGELGESGLFGGGDLTKLAEKRPADFLIRWLSDPAAINRSHRMPQFTFTPDELKSLDLWWQEQGAKPAAGSAGRAGEAERLVTSLRCANCHVLKRNDAGLAAASLAPLTAKSNWSSSCATNADRAKGRPGYRLADEDRAALVAYYSQPRPGTKLSPQARGRDLLVQLNCLACHQREGIERNVAGTLRVPSRANEPHSKNDGTRSVPAALQDRLVAVAENHAALAPLVPAMTPPALNGVGDKLLDAALADSIRRQGPPHRPYLLVQMPKFALSDAQLADLTAYFTATDRVPESSPHAPREASVSRSETATIAALTAAGPRLVTSDGLSCTSCHQIGSVPPAKAPLNARGPDISMLEKRIRREWYDRWCDNPARIVPRMEMPAVKIPVRGVLNEKVADQLAAVWQILNSPGFEPPEPNPVRVLRLSGVPGEIEHPIVIHDVVKDRDKTWLFPLVIGLPNRDNVLFDLETNRLAAWWLGDTARQRTKGKSWYWEIGGHPISLGTHTGIDPALVVDGKEVRPAKIGQFGSELIQYSAGHPVVFSYQVQYPGLGNDQGPLSVTIGNVVRELGRNEIGHGFYHRVDAHHFPKESKLRLQILSPQVAARSRWDAATSMLRLPTLEETTISFRSRSRSRFLWNTDGSVTVDSVYREADSQWMVDVTVEYRTHLPVDQFPVTWSSGLFKAQSLAIAPGISGTRLPLDDSIMPSGLAWRPGGALVFCTLKGEVFEASDVNGDGDEDFLETLIDGLPTPYGIFAGGPEPTDIDVATKTSLVRLRFAPHDGPPLVFPIASGWGATDDYHDWAVGLVKGDANGYWLALPCQQDSRGEAAARLRGRFLKLTPREPTPDNSREFDIEVISAGHRFPMGLARNREGEIFVTDNQGNYNPFNELNHVRKGAHFGFINALEKEQGFRPPPLAEPAINIPHPWTRSVNGICFLETPVGWVKDAERPQTHAGTASEAGAPRGSSAAAASTHPTMFGPLEGQLVGCEYDTRRLIRMSLQKVGDMFQGAAYPLSVPPEDVEKGLLGPIVCAVKPTTGELYVGEIHDSGWGAGNNIGQIVKIKIEPEKLPCGIAEVRATSGGFAIDFMQPVDRAKAADLASYAIESYRRESTPAYGGPDIDRRIEKIGSAEVAADGKRVMLTLPNLRAGFVYELKLKNLAPAGSVFFPDEAHYTLHKIP